jgi:GNAT superfamily N-acetyltransferase
VHVASKLRGQKIGATLMNWAITEARRRNCHRVQLTTNKLRQQAHRFYERLGFQPTHEGMKLMLSPKPYNI